MGKAGWKVGEVWARGGKARQAVLMAGKPREVL